MGQVEIEAKAWKQRRRSQAAAAIEEARDDIGELLLET